jgi:hypothetical protein
MPRHALRAFFRRAALVAPLALSGCWPGPINCPDQTLTVFVDGGLPDILDQQTCRVLCEGRPPVIRSCAPGPAAGQLDCVGSTLCATGRRPAGMVARRASGDEVGRFFAEVAQLEHASVHAFGRLAAELRIHDAPKELIAAAERSAREEVRHARAMGRLARRFGVRPLRARVRQIAARSLMALAEENAAEGCVRETFGAALAGWQARASQDQEVRAAMAGIAADEERHAELAWAVDAWARRRLGRSERRHLTVVRQNAAAMIAAELQQAPPPSLIRLAGLPSPVEARALFAEAAPLFA